MSRWNMLGVLSLALFGAALISWLPPFSAGGNWQLFSAVLALPLSVVAGLKGSRWWLVITGSIVALVAAFFWILSRGH